ncbi:MAG: hypothetical protein R2688_06440 [Fimbriimonadaceae bacterium]
MCSGCGKKEAVVYPEFVKGEIAPATNDHPLQKAGLQALNDVGDLRTRSNFTPTLRARFISRLTPSLNSLISNAGDGIPYTPRDLYEETEWLEGLSIISRAAAMKIEDSIAEGSWDTANRLVIGVTQAGYSLTEADTLYAATGIEMIETVRAAYAPHLSKAPAGILSQLSTSLTNLERKRPQMELPIRNEAQNFDFAVQYIQDQMIAGKLENLESTFFKGSRPAIDYLKNLPEEERPSYFERFRNEGDDWIKHYSDAVVLPRSQRTEFEFDRRADRPWKRFAFQVYSVVETYVAMNDRHNARQRLFILTAYSYAQSKAKGEAPLDFNSLPEAIRMDPYSGQEFPYRRAGKDFQIYSVGEDLRDDGGESNQSGLEPDLMLEGASF